MSKTPIFLTALLGANTLFAEVTIDFAVVDTSAVPQMAGYVSQDIHVLSTQDWTTASMSVSLTSGSIYQDTSPYAGDTAPPSIMIQYFPLLAYDTYVGIIDDTTMLLPGAIDIGGAEHATYRFDTEAIDITWHNETPTDYGELETGRLTLSDDAQGTMGFSVSEGGKFVVVFNFNIVNGVVETDVCAGIPGCNIMGLDELDRVLTHWNQNVPVGNELMGDYQHDGYVGLDDLDAVLHFWNIQTTRPTVDLTYDHFPTWDDGKVDIIDLTRVYSNWNHYVPPGDPDADYVGVGYIGQDNLNAVMSNWLYEEPVVSSVPEPASLLCAGPILLLCLRRR